MLLRTCTGPGIVHPHSLSDSPADKASPSSVERHCFSRFQKSLQVDFPLNTSSSSSASASSLLFNSLCARSSPALLCATLGFNRDVDRDNSNVRLSLFGKRNLVLLRKESKATIAAMCRSPPSPELLFFRRSRRPSGERSGGERAECRETCVVCAAGGKEGGRAGSHSRHWSRGRAETGRAYERAASEVIHSLQVFGASRYSM